MACFTGELSALTLPCSCMVNSCFAASKGLPCRGSLAAHFGKASNIPLPAHSHTLRGQPIGCVLSRYQTPFVMVKNHNLMDRGNTIHAFTPASSMATLCGSSTIPEQHTRSPAYSHAIPQSLRSQSPSLPQPRSGVPVYVMLPLDTVSFCLVLGVKSQTSYLVHARTFLSCR